MYKDEEIQGKVNSFIVRNLPAVGFILGVKILDSYLSFPLAMGLGSICYGFLLYWIPPRPKRTFGNWIILTILLSATLFVISWLLVWVGWIKD